MTTIREQIETYYKELPEHSDVEPDHSHWYSPYLPKCMNESALKELNDSLRPGEDADKRIYTHLYGERILSLDGKEIIEYHLNTEGYRTFDFFRDPDEKIRNVLILGDSFTFGIGVNDEQTYSSYIHKFLNNFSSNVLEENNKRAKTVVWNLGVPGISNDGITRNLFHFMKYFKPMTVFILWTYDHRREWIDDKNMLHKIVTNHPRTQQNNSHIYKSFMQQGNKYWDTYSFEKNQLLAMLLCEINQIPLINFSIKYFPKLDFTRDNEHPGPESHKLFSAILYRELVKINSFEEEREKQYQEYIDFLESL